MKFTADNSYLLQYIGEIECGKIIVGQELWQELRNLKEDIVCDAYIYDTEDAMLRINFMENCIRLTKSPFFGKPMILMLWQKAFIEAVYSFKMSDTTYRRFQKVLLLIARKNTKSETCSAIGMSEFFLGEAGADIVCSSNDDAQASLIYDAMDTMRHLIDPNDKDTKRNQRFILNKINNTKVFKISDRTRNKEGRNVDVVFLDESHEMKDNVIAKSLEQSQSLKKEPLFINLTTEGFVVDGYLDHELELARKIIKGETDDPYSERVLAWLYTQDSEQEIWTNPKSWVKSNPSLGVVKEWEYMEKQVALAKVSKADRIFILNKDFNIKQNSAVAWLNLEDYDYKATYNLEDFRGCVCLGAVDLSETTDLTCAKILIMRPDDDTKYVYTKYFIPEGKLTESDDAKAGAKYSEWAKAGYIRLSEGYDNDLSLVADWFRELYEKYDIKLWKCGYDQRFAKDFINKMEYYNWYKSTDDLVMIVQNAQTLSNAIKLLESDMIHHIVNYNENPVDKWCLKNACLKVNDMGQVLIIKSEPTKRIDGAVTMAILWEMYRQYKSEWKGLIETNNRS